MTTAAPQTPPADPNSDYPENRRLRRALIALAALAVVLTVVFYLLYNNGSVLSRLGFAVAGGIVTANLTALIVWSIPRWAHAFGIPHELDDDERHRQIISRSTRPSWAVALAMVLFGGMVLNNWYCYAVGVAMTLVYVGAIVVNSRRL